VAPLRNIALSPCRCHVAAGFFGIGWPAYRRRLPQLRVDPTGTAKLVGAGSSAACRVRGAPAAIAWIVSNWDSPL
jgi:hypothetical protein